ncbi:MAG: M1 family metallopeptidase [Acidobacteria bacterium]|nr:M1 family metallopeptidase [Acidobacteriota bacterium]
MKRLTIVLALALAPSLVWGATRLGKDVVPFEYRLEVTPDTHRESFVVEEVIRVRVSAPVSTITMHAADLEIERAMVRSVDGRQKPTVEIDAGSQTVSLVLERPLKPGEAEIRMTVRGKLGRSLRGLYLSEASGRRYALTQLQPTDARRFFACFDEPALKAQFDLIAVVDARESAISNGRIVSILPGLVPGTKRIRFDKTPPISTYMLALGVGELDCLGDRVGNVQLRFCAQPEKVALGKFVLASARRALEFYEDYTGVDYPFDKLDLVAVPDLSPGAMENPGAIFFREATALVDVGKAPPETRRWVATLVTHEIAHMWVGDLVTARWWDDLWLNEGLATWLSRKAMAATQAEVEPGVASVFSTLKALDMDALEGSRAPRSQVDDPATVIELFDAITNDKPAAAMAMAETIAGEDAVRRGLRSYLVSWSWADASTEDFLASMEPEIGAAGVATIRDFVTRPGFPKIDVTSRCEEGRQWVLATQRPVRESLAGAGYWTVPLCVRPAAGGEVSCTTLREREAEIEVGPCSGDVVANPGSTAFYRASYEPGAVRRMLDENGATLSSGDRIMLLDAEWSSFRAGDRTVGEMLENADVLLRRETSATVISQIAMQLWSIQGSIAEETELGAFRRWAAEAARAGAGRVLEGRPEDAQRKLDGELDWIGGMIGDDAEVRARGAAFARDYLRDPWKDRSANTDVMLALAARGGDEALYDAFAERLKKTRSEQERYRLVWTLGFFSDPALVDRTLRMTIDGTVRSQDAATLIARLLWRRETAGRAWAFLRDEWPKLMETLPPGFTSDRIVRATGAFCDSSRREEVERFFSSPDAPAAPRALAASLASIDACVSLKERHRGELGSWLAARNAAR